MKKLTLNYILPALLALLLSECREPYNIETEGKPGLLVIDGKITDEPGPYFLNLGTTSAPGKAPDPLGGAVVSIKDDLGNTEFYAQTAVGKYQLNGSSVTGRPGGSYTLHITLSDGRQYESTQEKMPSAPKPVDATTIKAEFEDFTTDNGELLSYWRVNTYLNTELPLNVVAYYRWEVAEVWNIFPTCFPGAISCPKICYVYDAFSNYKLVVINAKDYTQPSIKNLLLMKRGVDFSFNGRHFFNVTQYSMNKGAYDYWHKVDQLISKSGSIFDTPPSIVIGNVKNLSNSKESVFGYFEASGSKLTRNFIDRGSVPTYVQTCFFYSPDFDYAKTTRYCFDCSNYPGATMVEPDWFD